MQTKVGELPLKRTEHEAFCQAYASMVSVDENDDKIKRMSLGKAYTAAGFVTKYPGQSGWRLYKTVYGIKERIQYLQERNIQDVSQKVAERKETIINTLIDFVKDVKQSPSVRIKACEVLARIDGLLTNKTELTAGEGSKTIILEWSQDGGESKDTLYS